MSVMKRVISAAVLGAVLATGCTVPVEEPTGTSGNKERRDQPRNEQKADSGPSYTVSQEQAIKSARSYLDTMPFSKAGLADQLSSQAGEGFPRKDAEFAVNHIDVDWNQQAVRSARSYLDTMAFSRQGLIEQLTSEYGEQFTREQAVYAANKVGLR